ncbi:MAG: hypothetical protein AAGF24_16220, partial [Cyanobacteria bacterium P01_H01_bin.121]
DQVPEKPFSVLLISAADKFHNASAIVRDLEAVGDQLWQRFSRGKAGVLWYYDGLASTLSKAAQQHVETDTDWRSPTLKRLTTQLQQRVERLESLAEHY